MLRCLSTQLDVIKSHADRAYPQECCGVLLGKIEKSGKWLEEVRRVENRWTAEVAAQMAAMVPEASMQEHSKTDRYWIDPKDLLMLQREARERSLQVIGIYHSHPDHAAVPSECDRALAWMSYSYLIVSVRQGIAQDLLCWSLDEHHQFQPEDVQIGV